MSIAPEGPNHKMRLQNARRMTHKTTRKHGKTVQKTGLAFSGRKLYSGDVSPYCHAYQRVTSAKLFPSLTKSWPFSLTVGK